MAPDFRIHRFAVPCVDGQSPNLIYPFWQGGLKAARHGFDMRLFHAVQDMWTTWKSKHILGEVVLDSSDRILTMLPSFAQTKMPDWMRVDEILEYNKSQTPSVGLMPVSQGSDFKLY